MEQLETHVPGYWISTVQLGGHTNDLDEIIAGISELTGEPSPMTKVVKELGMLPYETMVFPTENGEVISWLEEDCERYATEEEAVAGHQAMVEKWST